MECESCDIHLNARSKKFFLFSTTSRNLVKLDKWQKKENKKKSALEIERERSTQRFFCLGEKKRSPQLSAVHLYAPHNCVILRQDRDSDTIFGIQNPSGVHRSQQTPSRVPVCVCDRFKTLSQALSGRADYFFFFFSS